MVDCTNFWFEMYSDGKRQDAFHENRKTGILTPSHLIKIFSPNPNMKWLHPNLKGFWLWLRKLRTFICVLKGAQNNSIAIILIG